MDQLLREMAGGEASEVTQALSPSQEFERRRGYVGSTEASTLLGCNKYDDVSKMWMRKTGRTPAPADDDPLPDHMLFGNLLEPVLLYWYENYRMMDDVRKLVGEVGLTPYVTEGKNQAIRGHEFLRATIDGYVRDDYAIHYGLECKTASAYVARDFGEEGTDNIPLHYVVQCQWHMAAHPGMPFVVVPGAMDTRFQRWVIERDDAIIDHLVEAGERFWNDFVLTDTPPPIDGTQGAWHVIRDRHQAGNSEVVHESWPALDAKFSMIIDVQKRIASLASELEGLRQEAADLMGAKAKVKGKHGSIHFRQNKPRKYPAYPDMVQQLFRVIRRLKPTVRKDVDFLAAKMTRKNTVFVDQPRTVYTYPKKGAQS